MPDITPQETLDTRASEFRLNRFESAWRSGEPMPRWQEHLPAGEESCSPALIFDLLQIDIEYRIKAGMPALLVEHYFEHPRLQQEDARLNARQQVELIRWEYQQRWQSGQRANRSEYEDAFPQHAEAIREMKPQSRCPRCRKVFFLEETCPSLHCPDCGCEPTLHGDAPSVVAETSSTRFDVRAYELIERLGEGGMGEVYRCGDPALGRDLAIKVMKADLRGQPEIERRFLREARITGSLQHPGIVPVHNLGRLSDGRLHYTMRLVRGQTFADILDDQASQAERLPYLLTIFEKICQAVAYAHSKHVIHRDLKPSNVMVGRFGEVQVMDWGLAKLLTTEGMATAEEPHLLAGATMIHTESEDVPGALTRAGSVIGTPPYMPPEQAQSDWELVDERTDVFALGSILCEILTGQPAYRGADGSEVFRRAKRGDLADALQRLETCGADAMLTRLCLECLSYEREGRPRDAGGVAERVNLYQTEVQERLRRTELERVEAEARAREEQARSEAEEARTREALARLAGERRARRRLLVLSGAVLITIATAFVLVRRSADQAIEAKNRALALAGEKAELAKAKSDLAESEKIASANAQKSQQAAKQEARKAQKVAEFLGGIFEASDPLGLTSQSIIFPRAAGEKLSAQELLGRGAEKCQRELKDQPDLQAAVLSVIGNAYVNLGEYERGKPLLEKALQLAETGERKPQNIASIKHALGSLYHAKGDYDKAEELYQSALKIREEAQPINELLVADTLFNLGWLLTDKEEHAEAVKCYQRCLALRTKILDKNDRLIALCQVGLATVYLDQNKNYLRAWQLIDQSIRTFRKLEGEHSSLAKAIGLFQSGIVRLHGSSELPLMKFVIAKPREEGVKMLEQCRQLVKDSPLGENHLIVAFVSGTLAIEYAKAMEDDRAKPCFEECLKIVEDRVGLWHPKLDNVAITYAALLNRQLKKQEADHFFQRVVQARENRFGTNHLQVANALVAYALIRDKFDPEREPSLIRARDIYRRAQPLKGVTSIRLYEACLSQLGGIALDVHRNPAEAEKIIRTAWDEFRDRAAIPLVRLAVLQNNLAIALLEQSKDGEAEQLMKGARRICEKEGQDGQIALQRNMDSLVQMYLRRRRPLEVAALSLERRKRWPNDPEQLLIAGRNWLQCVPLVGRDKSKLDQAEQKLRKDYLDRGTAACRTALDLYRKKGGSKHPGYKFCLSWLSRGLYDSQRYPEAEKLVEEFLSLCRKDREDGNPEVAKVLNFRVQVRMAQRKYEGVEGDLQEAERILRAVPLKQERIFGAAIHNERRVTLELLIQLYEATGEKDKAIQYRKRLIEKNVAQEKAKP